MLSIKILQQIDVAKNTKYENTYFLKNNFQWNKTRIDAEN